MSTIQVLPIYNSSTFNSITGVGGNSLTVAQANALYVQKDATNVVFNGTLVAVNESVTGSSQLGSADIITTNVGKLSISKVATLDSTTSTLNISGNIFATSANAYFASANINKLIIPNTAILDSSNTTTQFQSNVGLYGNVTISGLNANINSNTIIGKSDNSTTFDAYGNTTFHGNVTLASPIVVNANSVIGKTNNTTTTDFYGNTTLHGNTILSSPLVLNANAIFGKSDNTTTNSIYGATALHGTLTVDNLPLTSTDLSGNVNNSNQLVPKKYVDSAIANVYSTNGNYTAINNFNANQAFNGTVVVANSFIASPGVFSLSEIPILQGNYTQPTGNALASKTYVDAQVSSILTNNETFLGNVVLSGTTTTSGAFYVNNNCNIGKTDNSTTTNIWGPTNVYGNVSLANVSLSSVPTLQSNISQPTGNCLTTKNYVDTQITTTQSMIPVVSAYPDTVSFGMQSIIRQSGTNYILEAPYLGTYTTSNSVGSYFTQYVNFIQQTNSAPTFNLAVNNVSLDFTYWYYQPANVFTVPGYVTRSFTDNTAAFSTAITTDSIQNMVGIFGLTFISATFNVTILNNNLIVYCPFSSYKCWNNPTVTSSSSQGPVLYNNNYNTNSIVMSYYPIQFGVVNGNKFSITVGYPNQMNNPGQSFWIGNCGYNIKIRGSVPSTSSGSGSYAGGSILTMPNSYSNTMSGAAWFSTS